MDLVLLHPLHSYNRRVSLEAIFVYVHHSYQTNQCRTLWLWTFRPVIGQEQKQKRVIELLGWLKDIIVRTLYMDRPVTSACHYARAYYTTMCVTSIYNPSCIYYCGVHDVAAHTLTADPVGVLGVSRRPQAMEGGLRPSGVRGKCYGKRQHRN